MARGVNGPFRPPSLNHKINVHVPLTQPAIDYCDTFFHTRTDPDWADINFGVFICIECSGVHRSMGAHLTKVKSVNLDEWSEEHVKVTSGRLFLPRPLVDIVVWVHV